MQIAFKQWVCDLEIGRYQDNRIALSLVRGGEVIAVCTVNLPERALNNDEVIIKNYSENNDIYKALLNAGVISEFIDVIPTGFVEVLKCKLLIKS